MPNAITYGPILDQIHNAACSHNVTVSTAESITGGAVASALVSQSGASAWFRGGAVAYTEDAKVALLGVDRMHAQACKSVSLQTCREMAEGARRVFGASYGVATTGYAERDDGTLPYAYIHVAGPQRDMGFSVRAPHGGMGRNAMRDFVTLQALLLLRDEICGQ